MKTVGVKELKNNLSAYLRMVQAGYSVLVTDRNEVIAEIREPLAVGGLELSNPLLGLLAKEGKIKLPIKGKKKKLTKSSVKSKAGTVLSLLEEDRNEE